MSSRDLESAGSQEMVRQVKKHGEIRRLLYLAEKYNIDVSILKELEEVTPREYDRPERERMMFPRFLKKLGRKSAFYRKLVLARDTE